MEKTYAWIANRGYKLYCNCIGHWFTFDERMRGANGIVRQVIVDSDNKCEICDCYRWVETLTPKEERSIRNNSYNAKFITKEECENEML